MQNQPSEFELLSNLADYPIINDPSLLLSIGDDSALVRFTNSTLAISTDVIVEGVHFDQSYFSVENIAYKAIAVNASDLAAMGASSRYFLAAVTSPRSFDLKTLLSELKRSANDLGSNLIGGDLSSGPCLAISVTAIGTLESESKVLLRSEANAGDTILVSGPLGGSSFGLRCLVANPQDTTSPQAVAHLRPSPQVTLGPFLAKCDVRCAIDVSDGLLGDLEHIAVASSVGVALYEVPIFAGATLVDALSGGEDYQLLFTSNRPDYIIDSCVNAGFVAPIPIGKCTDIPTERTLFGKNYKPEGYVHDL